LNQRQEEIPSSCQTSGRDIETVSTIKEKIMASERYKGFRFRYVHDVESKGRVRVYVERQPSYGGRSTDSDVIHRWPGKNGSPSYICFKSERKPRTYSEAKKLAHQWADATLRYIHTGIPISDQIN
jgi:hypothetical protein